MRKDRKLTKAEFTMLMEKNEELKRKRKRIMNRLEEEYTYESKEKPYFVNSHYGTW